MDRQTNLYGFVIAADKKAVKTAACKAIEEMRHLARSRNSDEIFGIVTNLYEW